MYNMSHPLFKGDSYSAAYQKLYYCRPFAGNFGMTHVADRQNYSSTNTPLAWKRRQ